MASAVMGWAVVVVVVVEDILKGYCWVSKQFEERKRPTQQFF